MERGPIPAAFAFGCHTIIPAVHEELKDKATFKPMCFVSMPITLLMYLPVAILGYWAFGDKVCVGRAFNAEGL